MFTRVVPLAALLFTGCSLAQWCAPSTAEPGAYEVLESTEGTVPLHEDLARSEDGGALLTLLREDASIEDALTQIRTVYGLPKDTRVGAEGDVQDLARGVAAKITSYAILLRDDGSGDWIAAGVYTASPLLERLRVVRIPTDARRVQHATLLTLLATCFTRPEVWFEIPVSSLDELLERQQDAYMLTSVRTFGGDDEMRWISLQQFLDAVAFTHPATRDATAFSAWFTGTSFHPLEIAPLLSSVTSNVDSRDLLRALSMLGR